MHSILLFAFLLFIHSCSAPLVDQDATFTTTSANHSNPGGESSTEKPTKVQQPGVDGKPGTERGNGSRSAGEHWQNWPWYAGAGGLIVVIIIGGIGAYVWYRHRN